MPRPVRILLAALALLAAFGLGWFLAAPRLQSDSGGAAQQSEPETPQRWTCSMHPQIDRPEPGKCPICHMDLIPREEDGGEDGDSATLSLSPRARTLSELAVAPVERRFVDAEIRLVGTLAADETRLGHITAWVAGRIDRLFVNYTGIAVREGDHMVELYSPEIRTAWKELRMASVSNETQVLASLRAAARERLRLWGLKPDQIERMRQAEQPRDHITIHAPMSGIVLDKHVAEGAYVEQGTRLYTIADLSQLWLELEAYESDLPWLRYGQQVRFEVPAHPGEQFEGRISFIHPTLDPRTRTVDVRVVVDNREGRLKPGLFARAVVQARVALGGQVMDPSLQGKWISPMHPEIIKDEPGQCDVCGMDLVRAESLGIFTESADLEAPLVIPASAPLITGERAVVYVEREPGRYTYREVVLGPRAGDHYLVREGLEEGERVVVQGNFLLDASAQLQGRPSMMSPEGGAAPRHDHGSMEMQEEAAPRPLALDEAGGEAWRSVLETYYPVQHALAMDDLDTATAAAAKLLETLDAVDPGTFDGPARQIWDEEVPRLRRGAEGIADGPGLMPLARTHFRTLSESAIRLARRFGAPPGDTAFLFSCPMAFNNQGAAWLQGDEELLNPYFGDEMLYCGEELDRFAGGADQP